MKSRYKIISKAEIVEVVDVGIDYINGFKVDEKAAYGCSYSSIITRDDICLAVEKALIGKQFNTGAFKDVVTDIDVKDLKCNDVTDISNVYKHGEKYYIQVADRSEENIIQAYLFELEFEFKNSLSSKLFKFYDLYQSEKAFLVSNSNEIYNSDIGFLFLDDKNVEECLVLDIHSLNKKSIYSFNVRDIHFRPGDGITQYVTFEINGTFNGSSFIEFELVSPIVLKFPVDKIIK